MTLTKMRLVARSPQQPPVHVSAETLNMSPNTAVAMVVIYSVTGVVTLLFVVIIIIGARRAYRYPDRYGPRNITGWPRQSRAKGLARAMLDTLPIVKFGEDKDVKAKDIELAQSTSSPPQVEAPRSSTEGHDDTDRGQPSAGDTASATGAATPTVEGIAPAIDDGPVASKPENHGCSICTDDFENGQDQRMLPCDHRFHPECVDPWLLNVSATCPLCRMDLQPDTPDSTDPEPTPDGEEADRATDLRGFGRRQSVASTSSEWLRMGAHRRAFFQNLRGAEQSPENMTRDQRVTVLRQLAHERRQQERHDRRMSTEEERRLRNRLQSLLGVRTNRVSPVLEEGAPAA